VLHKRLGLIGAVTALVLPIAPAHAASEFLTLPNAVQPVAPSIAATDPTQTGALGFSGDPAAATCAAPVTAEAPADVVARHADRYPLTNQTDQAQCVTVSLDPRNCFQAPNQIQSAAYIPSFNPTLIAGPNFAGDIGDPPAEANTARQYSLTVPAGSRFEVVVNAIEAAPTGLCGAYGLTLSSDKPWVKTLPAIAGAAVTGETLSASAEWGSPVPIVTRRWQRCDAAGANCVDVPGETTGAYPGATVGTYVVTDADLGHTLRVIETATDASDPALSATTVGPATTPVQSGAPRPAYTRTTSTGTVEQGGALVPGSQGLDDTTVDFAFPFAVSFFGAEYTSARLSSNGNIQFDSDNPTERNGALPTTQFGPAILAHWDDLVTTASGEGVYVTVTGDAPNRVLHLVWRADRFDPAMSVMDQVNFEVRLRESSPTISLVYGNVTGSGASATVGLQAASISPFSDTFPFSLPAGLQIDYASSRPTIAGTAREGLALSANDATWIGPGTITTSFQWLECDAAGGGCAAISGATGATFTPAAAHVGRRLRLRATASNDRGSTALVSAPTDPVAAAPGSAAPDRTLPVIRKLTLTNRTFAVARGATPISAAAKAKRGTNVRSSVSEAGTARYAVQRELRGRRVGKRCLKATRMRRKAKRCWRYQAVQAYTRKVKAGSNVFWFTGRIGNLALAPNRYRVVMRVTDTAGNVSVNRWVRFRIVAR
jgi:hypothetical protein